MKINIIAPNNGAGLTQHIKILTSTIQNMNAEAVITDIYSRKKLPQWRWNTRNFVSARLVDFYLSPYRRLLSSMAIYDLNIHVELAQPQRFLLARKNVFIPHQEWFRDEWMYFVRAFDQVFCLTRFCHKIFQDLNPQSLYLGFSSEDIYDESVSKSFKEFFHLAGQSKYKGTDRLIDLWRRHPEWPTLTIVQHPRHAKLENLRNIRHIISEHLDEKTLRAYQNSIGIHLCLSEAEGFGHYIVEAMSSKAVVVSVDAPPMNELVEATRGFLVRSNGQKSVGLGTNFYFNQTELEHTISQLLKMKLTDLETLGERAREWYLWNHQRFTNEFELRITELLHA